MIPLDLLIMGFVCLVPAGIIAILALFFCVPRTYEGFLLDVLPLFVIFCTIFETWSFYSDSVLLDTLSLSFFIVMSMHCMLIWHNKVTEEKWKNATIKQLKK